MNKKVLILVVAVIAVFGVYVIISSNKVKTTNGTSKELKDNNIVSSSGDSIQTSGIVINKNEITNIAKFYKYKSGDIDMEIMAVKASDGSVRTALNTCQVCYDSGRGYYKQQGDYMVCQNCGNKFNLNQIEKIKGGCNPVPILDEDKIETSDTINISTKYLDSQKKYFENWKI